MTRRNPLSFVICRHSGKQDRNRGSLSRYGSFPKSFTQGRALRVDELNRHVFLGPVVWEDRRAVPATPEMCEQIVVRSNDAQQLEIALGFPSSAGMRSSGGPIPKPIAPRAPANADVPDRCIPKTSTPMQQNYLGSFTRFQWMSSTQTTSQLFRTTYDNRKCRNIAASNNWVIKTGCDVTASSPTFYVAAMSHDHVRGRTTVYFARTNPPRTTIATR